MSPTPMQPITRPDILDSDKYVPVEQTEAARQAIALNAETLAQYAANMWALLAEVREHLYRAAAVEDSARVDAPLTPQDWLAWARMYARVTGAISGVTGDAGWGWSEAVLIARDQGVEINPD